MEIKNVLVKDIKFAPYNPRKISEETLEKLKRSIEEFGYIEPIIVNKQTMHVVGGNQRLKVLQQLGVEEIEVIIVDLDDAHEKALNIALNKITGEWDLPLLKDLLEELDTGEIDIELTGFDLPEIEELMTQFHIEPDIKEDDVPPLPEKAITQLGDLWLLGKHKLLCGDATKKEDVEKLLNYKMDRVLITDPPYGISVVDKEGKIGNDNLCKNNIYKPIINDDTIETAKKMYELVNNGLIDKYIIFGGNYFTEFLPPSPCWIIWDKKGEMNSNDFADCEIMWTNFNRPSKIITCLWRGMIKEGENDKRLHPTQKPIKLLTKIIEEYAGKNDIIVDLFLGSGSILIACEQLSRICYGMEIDPYYCDVIIKRWENLTGQKAELMR